MVALGPSAGLGPDRAAARIAAERCGWDEARVDAEVAAFRARMRSLRPRPERAAARR
jgi:hypothetical protein